MHRMRHSLVLISFLPVSLGVMEWELRRAELESWTSPDPGWGVRGHSLELLEPSYERLIGDPTAWVPGTGGPVEGEPVLVSASTLTAMRVEKLARKPIAAPRKSGSEH